MIGKEKYNLFVKFYEEGVDLKKILENKGTVNFSLLSIFVTGIFFNEKKLLDLIDSSTIPNSISIGLICIDLLFLVLCLFFTLNIFLGKTYKFLIPENYMQIFFSQTFASDEDKYYELISRLKFNIDHNATLNRKKSQSLKWSQIFLMFSLVNSLVIILLICV